MALVRLAQEFESRAESSQRLPCLPAPASELCRANSTVFCGVFRVAGCSWSACCVCDLCAIVMKSAIGVNDGYLGHVTLTSS